MSGLCERAAQQAGQRVRGQVEEQPQAEGETFPCHTQSWGQEVQPGQQEKEIQ